VLTFEVRKQKGLYGTVLETRLPSYAEGWAYLTFFELKLQRTYLHAGKRRSYVSASCATPEGFTQATFPFAKAAYGFAGGKTLTTSIQRTCRVSGR
jgi:hypothetical protein